jgi:hypothetical protein
VPFGSYQLGLKLLCLDEQVYTGILAYWEVFQENGCQLEWQSAISHRLSVVFIVAGMFVITATKDITDC